jgi:hypothetical protein
MSGKSGMLFGTMTIKQKNKIVKKKDGKKFIIVRILQWYIRLRQDRNGKGGYDVNIFYSEISGTALKYTLFLTKGVYGNKIVTN